MTTGVLPSANTAPRTVHWSAMPAWTWCGLALGVIALKAWFTTGQGMDDFLGDMDDAARLVQVRAFMAGAPWFDTTTFTMGGAGGMLSHWSRLIDLPIAMLIWCAGLFVPVAQAELFARAVWPMMVLAPLLSVLLKTVTDTAGEQAGRIALALAMLCPLGIYQFDVGRIDHHNVMIATTVSAAVMMWAYPRSGGAWLWSGGLCGLALTIGFESLAPVAALAIFAALWGLFDRAQARQAQLFTGALMAAIAGGFLLSIPPSRWFAIHCDAISLNIVSLALMAGAGLIAALSAGRAWSWQARMGVSALAAGTGLVIYARLNPVCLAGPMGELPAALKPIWLDYVAETRSIAADFLSGRIEQSLGLIAYFVAALAAQVSNFRHSPTRGNVFLLAALGAFIALACWQYKYLSYASFLAVAPLACWISGLRGTASVGPKVTQVLAAITVSQASLIGVSSLIQKAIAAPVIMSEGIRVGAEACETNSAVADLNVLPPGLIAARIDLGAYIIAETPHRVLSAPYHRIAGAIIANHHIFAARTPDEARKVLEREKIDYVVTCKGLDDPFVDSDDWKGTLRADLVHGKAPAYLEPVALANPATLFSVWRVNRAKLNPQP